MALGLRTALLVGATGLVGSHLLRRLLEHAAYERVIVWTRREIPLHDPKLSQVIVDFEHLQTYAPSLTAPDVYCALGTTIKAAGSQPAFARVDHTYPLEIARLARKRSAQRFAMVSALGADARSRIFYSRVKGEAEDAIGALEFPKLWFFRPSLIVGDREQARAGERAALAISNVISPLLIGPLRKYRPIHADTIAAAMIYAATQDVPSGVIQSDQIAALAALAG